jgi:hypothetical protein
LKGRKDVAEDNLLHLENSRESALLLARQNKNWQKVVCCKGTVCLLPEQVSEIVYSIIKKHIK